MIETTRKKPTDLRDRRLSHIVKESVLTTLRKLIKTSQLINFINTIFLFHNQNLQSGNARYKKALTYQHKPFIRPDTCHFVLTSVDDR